MVSLQEAPNLIWILVVIGMVAALGALILTEFSNSMDSTATTTFNNETQTVVDASTLVVFSNSNQDFGNYSYVYVTNASDGIPLPSTNYSITYAGLIMQSGEFNGDNVNVTYTQKYYNTAGNVMANSTMGLVNMTKQLPTVGIVIGVALVIGIVVSLLVYFGIEGRKY